MSEYELHAVEEVVAGESLRDHLESRDIVVTKKHLDTIYAALIARQRARPPEERTSLARKSDVVATVDEIDLETIAAVRTLTPLLF